MSAVQIPPSELILNPDGSLYHLHLLPEDVAQNVILVGDPGRVKMIAENFSSIVVHKHNREFECLTGIYNDQPVTVIGTGIGPDNIDIVLNELDAAVNIDLAKRRIGEEQTSLNIIRIGTCGGLYPDLTPDSWIASSHALGLDNLMWFYEHAEKDNAIVDEIMFQSGWPSQLGRPYLTYADPDLLQKIADGIPKGITATAPGFYGPQGRSIRLKPAFENMQEKLANFHSGELRITNFEMETSALYGLSSLLGHKALTICVVIANRALKTESKNYKDSMKALITHVLERLTV